MIVACYAMMGVAGLMLLGLFYYDRSRRELLYISIIRANRAALGILPHFSVAQVNLPVAALQCN